MKKQNYYGQIIRSQFMDTYKESCLFCKSYLNYKEKNLIIYENDAVYSFLNYKPSTFGHIMIVLKSHIVDLNDINPSLSSQVFHGIDGSYIAIKEIITKDPKQVIEYYNTLTNSPPEPISRECALEQLAKGIPSNSPDGYNWGMNYGYKAGQRVSHLHFHLFPRYSGLGIATAMRKHLN